MVWDVNGTPSVFPPSEMGLYRLRLAGWKLESPGSYANDLSNIKVC